ncbi:DUF7094 domain-containing protein [Halobacterium noricense]|jgi:hypothetical protein|uniref:DUF7094 domain-containing protein n=1 Tax=Halobacterium noricense TaxID=223182 RepID=UPI001E5B9C35|nr:hypothetical protein [Halobacterium noricense]UHH26550.1 hypothetical protein LT974_06320 [Halobacterium noricense]
MSRVRPALAAVLLVVTAATASLAVGGGVAAPVEPGDDPVVGTSPNSARVLLLAEADAAEYSEPNTSVMSTLQTGHTALSLDLQRRTVAQRLDSTDNRSARRTILKNAISEAANHVDALRARATTAQRAYINGDITADEYVRRLGVIHAEAGSLSASLGGSSTLQSLYTYAYDDGFSELGIQVYRLRAQLATVEGPVRERVADVLQGNRDRIRVHVTAGDGVMLSTIDDGSYIRETVRPDNVEETLGGDISDAPSVIQRQYPWVSNHSTSTSIETRGSGYAFYYTANYGHGQISSYIDTTTERVYAENHRQTLAQLPIEIEGQHATTSAMLSTSRTYAGGPLLVQVENERGDPLDTTVLLNGTALGNTGNDGRLWLLSPAGEYSVTTMHDGTTLEVNVTARPIPGTVRPPGSASTSTTNL